MNTKGILGALGVVGAAVGAIVIGTGTADLGRESTLESIDIATMSEAQRKDKVVRTKYGKLVRITHIEVAEDATITEGTDLGDVVEVQARDIPENALCNLIIDAEETTIKILYADPDGSSRKIPNVPELKDYFGKVSWPVKIAGSSDHDKWLWNGMFKSTDCLKVAEHEATYLGSAIAEFLKKDAAFQKRLLRTTGKCDVDDGAGGKISVECTVPVGDPRVIAGRKVRVPHAWAGLDHGVNFITATNGVVEDRIPEVIEDEPIPIDGGVSVDGGVIEKP